MLIIEGLSAREVSEQLGVAENILYRWKQEHINDLEANKPTGVQSPKEMAEEIEQLRKQLAKCQRMNAILKKRWPTSARKMNALPIHQRKLL